MLTHPVLLVLLPCSVLYSQQKGVDVMILYHLDRSAALHEGQQINYVCFDDPLFGELSHFGSHILSFAKGSSFLLSVNEFQSFANTYNLEIRLEEIRKKNYPRYPSRLKALFCVKQIRDLFPWSEFFPLTKDSRICEIEYDGPLFEFDARFLRGRAVQDLLNPIPGADLINQLMKTSADLEKYWSRTLSDTPLFELLVPLPVTVKQSVSLDSYPDFCFFKPFPPDT